jgi:hypothetical protein
MSTTALLALCSTWRREIEEFEDLSEQGVQLTPRLRALHGERQALLNDVSKALADRDNPQRRPRARATFLPELDANTDGEGKLLLVMLNDVMGSGLINGASEIGETGRPEKTNRVIANEPLALVAEQELRAIRIKDRRRVLVLRGDWQNKLYEALLASGGRFPFETTSSVIRACRSEKLLFRWLKGTRDVRHQATLRDALAQLARVTKRRTETAE